MLGVVFHILNEEVATWKVCAKVEPKVFINKPIKQKFNMQHLESEPDYLHNAITGDETSAYE